MWQIVINGPGYFDTSYDLPEGLTFLGRADNNDIVLSGDEVSRRHAKIDVKVDGAVTVEDLGSRNGTKVNGQATAGAKAVVAGDLIGIGENSLAVRLPTPAERARTDLVDPSKVPANVDISGEVLLARGFEENPFLSKFGQAEKIDTKVWVSSQSLAPQKEASLEEYETLFLLLKVTEKLHAATGLAQFLEGVVDLVMDVTGAKTGIALLKDATGRLAPDIVRHRGPLTPGELPVSESIVTEVLRKKMSLAVHDARSDARFADKESVVQYEVTQVICAPMLRGDEILGVLYLTRDGSAKETLTRMVDVVGALAHLAATGVEAWRLKERTVAEERLRRALERFHAPAVVDRMVAEAAAGIASPRGFEPREATVMFADISGFTAFTERVPAEKVSELLAEFYARMTRVVFSFDGSVDKPAGDALLAVFGAPFARPDDASRAVRCALSCRREFNEMMNRRPPDQRCGLKIALASGKVLAGSLGVGTQVEFTALGDAVNVAAKLQESSQPGQVLITGKMLAGTGARFDVAPLGERELKGRKEKVPVFEVLDEDSEIHTLPGKNAKAETKVK